ncbi:UDP-N-acetylmuramoyl-tripeptide--D-alanyl-D-alanine ligase [Agarilytica rhodophyticola]|uniref:UDP-N-acetylmuramoyl-tripeptide--D-alanyl-D- alanine ligase n=1 Tax=Agarilytica rhodophyticola TaxID=1737490 RepID=UPI000B341E95|nr:UDP-N-acetylmuramoyl-tripeptide--D-alanyl-D-alanine ligase [Agarilytica rhodophyticola]
MKLSTLVEHKIGSLIGPDCEFDSVCTDTRTIKKGQLFVALRGEHFDGHDMIDVAMEKGASGVVVESDSDERNTKAKNIEHKAPALLVKDSTLALGKISQIYRDHFSGRVVALTGSCGKTTVKGMLKNICEKAGSCIATDGNFNNHIGVPLTLLRLKSQADYAVIEAGTSGKKEIQYLTDLIKPDIALITNVKASHLEGLGSEAAIAEEKSDIYCHESTNTVIVNLDDKYRDKMLEKAGERDIIGFTLQPEASVSPTLKAKMQLVCLQEYQSNNIGLIHFKVKLFDKSFDINMKVLGKHNIANALAAIACAGALNISAEDIKAGLENFSGTPGRMQYVAGINNAMLVNDAYNANPGSMNAAIDFLSQHKHSVLICGDMGELGHEEDLLHQEVGIYAKTQGIEKLFAVGDKARYIADAFGESAKWFAEKDDLIAEVKPLLDEETVVLIKGSRSTKMETVVQALSSAGEKN